MISLFLKILRFIWQRRFDEADADLQEERTSLSAFDADVKKLTTTKEQNKQTIEDLKLQVQKLQHEIKQFSTERKVAEKTVQELVKTNPWIKDQKE